MQQIRYARLYARDLEVLYVTTRTLANVANLNQVQAYECRCIHYFIYNYKIKWGICNSLNMKPETLIEELCDVSAT